MRGAIRALVEPVWVDQRMRHRQQARALMVIDDDHVEPGVAGLLQRLERLRSAIDAHGDLAPRAFSSTSALPEGP